MPRLTPTEAVDRVADAIERAAQAIEDALARDRYDEAWVEAHRLYTVTEAARIAAARQRGRVLTTYAERDDRTLSQTARRFGLTAPRASQIMRPARRGKDKPQGSAPNPGQTAGKG